MLAIVVITITGLSVNMKVEAYTFDQINSGIVHSEHVTSVMERLWDTSGACTSQIKNKDYSHMDSCLHFTEILDKYLTETMIMTEEDTKQITGFGFTP